MPFQEPGQVTAPEMSFIQQPNGTHPAGIFLGPLGLRAGWAIALYLLLTIAFGVLLFTAVFAASGQMRALKQERQQHKLAQQAAQAQHRAAPIAPLEISSAGLTELAETGAVLLAAAILASMEKRKFGVYGLPARRVRDALPGAFFGIVAISLLVGLLRAFHLLFFDSRLLQGAAILRNGLGWLLVFVCVGIFEEFFFRGYIQFTLMRGLLSVGRRIAPGQEQKAAFWIAALVWSTLFGATHLSNAGEDVMGIVSVFAAGVVFSYALWRTGSLWWGIGFHMTWDWGQSFLYGVPDSGHVSTGRLFATHTAGPLLWSGGTAGPEGSLLVLPVLALVALTIRLHPQERQPAVEPISLPHSPNSAALSSIP